MTWMPEEFSGLDYTCLIFIIWILEYMCRARTFYNENSGNRKRVILTREMVTESISDRTACSSHPLANA